MSVPKMLGVDPLTAFWRAVRLLFLMSFGALFGMMVCGMTPAGDLLGGLLGSMIGVVVHMNTRRILWGVYRALREW